MAHTYTLTMWRPRFWHPSAPEPYNHVGTADRTATTIEAPNDKIALARAAKLMAPNQFRVGTLKTTKKGRLVAQYYVLHVMKKVAWDDPPEHIFDEYCSFFAVDDKSALERFSPPYCSSNGWQCTTLHGPNGELRSQLI